MADFNSIAKKWQKKWEESGIFNVKEDPEKKKYYVLEMYPYPSASFLHMGHVRNFTIGDIYARFKRMNGFNVLYPMGYDSFGLPAETASKKEGIHPKEYTQKAIAKIMEYQKASGNSYDWSRTLSSHDPDYYRWNQYFFIKLYEKGLAYRKKAPVNWCENCQSVLANEEAEGGKCWRCEGDVTKKELEQWFFKITAYADRLLSDLDKIDWPERIKVMQKNWIGKSYGTEINFEMIDPEDNITNSEFVFFHAYKDNAEGAFWPWLKKEIESRGGKVVYAPSLPNPDEPDIEKWAQLALKNYKFNEKTVLITHSLGGVLAMKLLPKLKTKIKKWIMIASPSSIKLLDGKKRPALEKCCDWKFDYNSIKEKVKDIIVLADEKDHLIRVESAIEVAQNLSAKYKVVVAEQTHFNNNIEPTILNEIVNKWPIFTTRPDTIFGVTFMVISAQHPKLMDLVTKENKKEVESFVKRCQKVKTPEEIESLDKDGVFTGSYAINPINNEKIPLWAGNFVLADYGCGMVMAVPAHDQRDFEFAKKYKIPIKVVIIPEDWTINPEKMARAFTDEGVLINSGDFDGTQSNDAIDDITKYLDKKGLGKKVVNYKIRDWLISRQRYWGTPIPMIHCPKCGVVPVSEKDLPVILPEKVDFKSINPLASNKEFLEVKCPKCSGKAKRETDTMGGFMDSSWYFLRYCDNKNKKEAFGVDKVNYWMPVDQYIGGAEHAVMHLMYARFFVKALKDLGFLDFDEPFSKLFNQGIVYKDGAKMSKSKGNVVYQTDISDKYGIDTARLFLMSVAAPDKVIEWRDEGIQGSFRALNKIFSLPEKKLSDKISKLTLSKTHRVIKQVTNEIDNFEYNKAIISIMELANHLSSLDEVPKEALESLLIILSPFTPHICEELWDQIGKKPFISTAKWPKFDESKIDEKAEAEEDMISSLISDIANVLELTKISKPKKITIFVAEKWQYGFFDKLKKTIEKTRNVGEVIKSCIDDKHQKEIAQLVPRLLKNESRIPKVIVEHSAELKNLESSKDLIEKHFNCKVEITEAEKSKEIKAKQAMPSKPAILVN